MLRALTFIFTTLIFWGCLISVSENIQAQAPSTSKASPSQETWIPLFNGKDLEGWTPKIRYHALGENFGNTFRVEGGVLKVGYDAYDQFGETFGHLFYKDSFSTTDCGSNIDLSVINARVDLVGRFEDSGVMIHGEKPETMGKGSGFSCLH